jgi:1,2-diacylglycerol 3-alpha-glucosyltransferase
MRRMVTGQFSESFPPLVMDGVSLTVQNYVVGLNKTLGPTYAMIPANPHLREPRNGGVYRFFSVPLVSRPPYRMGLPQLDPAFKVELRKVKLDLVHAHSPFFVGKFALRLARRRGIPIVATFHSKYRENFTRAVHIPPLVDWGIHQIVEFFEAVDEVWVPTEASLDTLREYGYRGGVQVVQNGVDLEPPVHKKSLRAKGERFLGVCPGEFLLLYVGQLAWEKNLDLLVESLEAVRRAGVSFRMAFVGEGYAAGALKSMVARLGLSDRTVFTGVVRDREALSACYARADCFLFPSRYDTSGMVVAEAAAFEVPAVLTEGSDAAAEVEDGVNGFLAANSMEAYSAKLRWLLAHPAAVRRAGVGARLTLHHSWQAVVSEVRDRYLRLAGGRR